MKKLLMLLVVSLGTNLHAQSAFSAGFQAGYRAGYCHGDPGCIAPPGVSSGPSISSLSDFENGYGSGFVQGWQDKANETASKKIRSVVVEPIQTSEYIESGTMRLMRENAEQAGEKTDD